MGKPSMSDASLLPDDDRVSPEDQAAALDRENTRYAGEFLAECATRTLSIG